MNLFLYKFKLFLRNIKINRNLVNIFFLGVSSGVPFFLILATLSIWLIESGLTKTQVGLFAWTTIPYSFKFFWSPFIDRFKIPFFCNFFGQRRGWLLLSQIFLIFSIIGLGTTNPGIDFKLTALFAFLVSLFSATQDIIIEAYRIEIMLSVDKNGFRLSLGSTISVLGYRLGMLVSSAGTLFFASIFNSWFIAYFLMSIFILLGVITTIFSFEPKIKNVLNINFNFFNFYFLFKKSFINFFKFDNFKFVIIFILFYKFSDTMLNSMSVIFLIEIGFSKIEIVYVVKFLGFITMIFGSIIGGIFIYRCILWYWLIFCCFIQFFSSFLFFIQSFFGNSMLMLFFTIGFDNFVCGIGQVTLITCLSRLCNGENIGIQYSLLSSFLSFVRINFSFIGGFLADHLKWHLFFSFVCLICVINLFFIIIFIFIKNSNFYKKSFMK